MEPSRLARYSAAPGTDLERPRQGVEALRVPKKEGHEAFRCADDAQQTPP